LLVSKLLEDALHHWIRELEALAEHGKGGGAVLAKIA